MRTIALGKVLKTAVDPLCSRVPNRWRCRPNPSQHPLPMAGLQPKTALPPRLTSPIPQEAELLSASPRYNPQMQPRLVHHGIVRRLTS
jgi:hypothetical protein